MRLSALARRTLKAAPRLPLDGPKGFQMSRNSSYPNDFFVLAKSYETAERVFGSWDANAHDRQAVTKSAKYKTTNHQQCLP